MRNVYVLFAIIYIILISSFYPRIVYAAGEFQADYDVQYAISPAGKTIVTQQVTLVNKLSNYYPKSYSLLLDSDKISNIIAYDDGGIITPTISVKDTKTEIGLQFNAKAIGLGKALKFTLRYEHAGVASKNGNIWEIYIPGIINDPDIGEYNVTLNVPPTFGPIAYLSPLPAKNHIWTREQMIRGGIAGAYGTSQNFQVNLSYELTNSSVIRQQQSITLPSNSAFQKVSIQSLTPTPDTVNSDDDGNWIAQYTLLPAQTIHIKADLDVSIFMSPRKDFVQPAVQIEKYLVAKPYWQSKDPTIITAAKPLVTPWQVYEYVVRTLSYDYEKISQITTQREGAIVALQAPKTAVCMEFTDVFIALARASGIGARRVVGYAYTDNPKLRPTSTESDVLHAWPEYYDTVRKLWIPIDPTWGNTTGGVDYFSKTDFNHIAFAVNGMDSQLPYSAGYFRSSDTLGKDVSVSFAPSPVAAIPSRINSTIEFPTQVNAGTTVDGTIVIHNASGAILSNVVITATSDVGGIATTKTVSEILPFGTNRIPIHATFPQSFQVSRGSIHLIVNDTSQVMQFTVQPMYWIVAISIASILGVLICILGLSRIFVWKKSHK